MASTVGKEVVRTFGPNAQPSASTARVVSVQLNPGTYALFSKTILTPTRPQGDLLSPTRAAGGHCVLDAGRSTDQSRVLINEYGSGGPTTFSNQMTVTLTAAQSVNLNCDAATPWRASDSSIIAIPITSSRSEDPESQNSVNAG